MIGSKSSHPIRTMARRFFRAVTCISILFTASPALSAQPQVVDRIVAVVNGDIIVHQDINEMLAPLVAELLQSGQPPEKINEIIFDQRQRLLSMLIDQKLMLQASTKYEITVSDKEVDAAVERMKEANKLTDERLRSALQNQGLSMAEFRNNYREQILLNRIENLEVTSRIVVSEDDIKAYYAQHADEYKGARQYHLRHLMMDAPAYAPAEEKTTAYKRMEAAMLALKAGEPFVEVVKRHADRKYAVAEGELGLFNLEDLAPALKEAVENLAIGQYTPILETGQGYQIIYLENIVETQSVSLAEKKDEIREKLLRETVKQRKQDWLETLRKNAQIKIIN
ncbi:MAG: SurA N-terminal domain-containing protein [Desulfobacterales bacterium]|nr:SurA N-terminal domain-containing protein [Desulfobacterales bacterium]